MAGVNTKGEILAHYPDGEDWIVAEADGIGGANLLVVGENYPFDYLVHHSYHFETEEEASTAAEWLDWKTRVGDSDPATFFSELEAGKKPWIDEPYDEELDPDAQ